MIEVNIFAGLRVVPLDTKVVAFIGLEDENCKAVPVTSVTPEIPWRFDGTLAELDEAMPEWAEAAEEHDCELITVGIFPTNATDPEDAFIPKNVSPELRSAAINGYSQKYSYLISL